MKWEYKVIKIAFDSNTLEDILDHYGDNGWELVSMVDRLGGYKLFVFKRMKEEEPISGIRVRTKL